MTDRTEQTPSHPGVTAAGIDLEQFIEAVTRGVARALAAQEDVAGHALPVGAVPGSVLTADQPIWVGFIFTPPGPGDFRPGRPPRVLT